MDKEIRERIIALVKSEVVPAVGCTEPIAVALCVAKAKETIGCLPEKITAYLSANILKNAMGVGIPGTGMIGLPIAIALGASVGKSEYELEVLKDVTPEAVEAGKHYISEKRINVQLKADAPSKLYIEIVVEAEGHKAVAVINGGHKDFVKMQKDDEILFERAASTTNEADADDDWLTLEKVYEFATTAPLSEIDFINQARELNEKAAAESLLGNYGHSLGKALSRPLGRGIMGDTIFSHILS